MSKRVSNKKGRQRVAPARSKGGRVFVPARRQGKTAFVEAKAAPVVNVPAPRPGLLGRLTRPVRRFFRGRG